MGVVSILRSALAHPLTRGADPDDPQTHVLRRRILKSKPFLRKIYHEWYAALAADVPGGDGEVLDLGSGAGFLPEFIADVVASELFLCPGIDVVLDGQRMPLAEASLRAIVMTDVFHHIPTARRFLSEAARCVRGGGVVAMIEPWYNKWANLIYTRLHHEPYHPDATQWEFDTTGPLSGANQALAWVVFERDRAVFEREFPQWTIETLRPFMPLRYLFSGGVSMRSLAPGFSFGAIAALERLFESSTAMFAH